MKKMNTRSIVMSALIGAIYVVLTVVNRHQAVMLRNFIKKECPKSFLMITNSSEIIGKGFRGFNS